MFDTWTSLADSVSNLFEISAISVTRKAERIGIVLLLLFCCKLLIDLVAAFGNRLASSPPWPLRFLARHRKRSLTVQSLAINAIRYFVYFAAFGYVLSELGIDYRAYIASLSVIGLAVGFGAQGLVQDVVTGFFIIFEGHFDVGDLVEIGGQTGRVSDMGLRVTRLRNYLGEEITIPNRSISSVGNYVNGGTRATVDVAVPDDGAIAARAGDLLQLLAGELAIQFGDTVLAPPEMRGIHKLRSGESYFRLRMTIWPAQEWVVNDQLLPRTRELFQREGIPIPHERITVFFRPSEDASQTK